MQKQIDAVLLDMDGTILNSIKSAEKVWTAWAINKGLDVESFIPTIHGKQAVATIRSLNLPDIDPETEAALITQAEINDVAGTEAIPGAIEFLTSLKDYRWAVVTSAPRQLALRRIAAAALPVPPLMISAEDIVNSKPAPDGFLLAAKKLGTRPDKCLVLEDSPAGILSAENAGTELLVITSTHHTKMENSHAAIADYRDLRINTEFDGSLLIQGLNRNGNDSIDYRLHKSPSVKQL